MSLYSILQDFIEREEGYIALIPVKKLFLTESYKVGNCIIYPSDKVNKDEIFRTTYNELFLEYDEDFFGGAIIACPVYFCCRYPFNSNNEEDLNILREMIAKGENILDVIRYVFCNINYSSNIPTRVGYLKNGISGILLINKSINMPKFITDKYINNSESIGEGLFVDISKQREYLDKFFTLEKDDCGEIGNVIKYALKQYSNIVLAENRTTKFMLSMSLIEYLANPYEYMSMKKVKAKIIPFIAKTKEELEELTEKFKYLTSKTDENNKQIGLRTCIVHNGTDIESLIKEEHEVYNTLRELQRYIYEVIKYLYDIYNQSWSSAEDMIQKLRLRADSNKREYEVKSFIDTLILIDIKFLNKAIEEVYLMYPDKKKVKFVLEDFLGLILVQARINRDGYKLPFQLFYDESCKSIFNSSIENIQDLDGFGCDTQYGEIDIYALKLEDYYGEMEYILKEYLEEMNDCIAEKSRFRNIIFISDRNLIDNEIIEKSLNTVKNVILGRLDKYKTTSCDKLIYFDVQYLIMTYLGIDITK
ncbi:hypothetical protein [Metaclostridioides mangenotii]|uniref:hypothetical protein n=1 Tax=Metaclostridioides mangenotii TaxID=1540 RepID=UPI0028EC6F15|nr:hypothetical protein [Clostridioides mangenotii]